MEKQVDLFNQPLFIVTGQKSFELINGKELVKQAFGKNEKTIFFSDFKGNPEFKNIEKGVALLKNSGFKQVIAIGGGSVIDMAKLLIYYSNSCAIDLAVSNDFSISQELNVIPTTAGSGSEETHFAVVYKDGVKHSITHPQLKPRRIFLEPELSWKCSKDQIIFSGLDALTQAIESFWSVNGNEQSRKYARLAIELMRENFHKAVLKNDFNAFKKVVIASNYAGKAINISKTTSCHALSYYFTSKHSVPHGLAVALLLPAIFKYHSIYWNSDLMKELINITGWDSNCPDEEIRSFLRMLGAPDSFNSIDINVDDIFTELQSTVNIERLKNNPIEINFKELKKMIV